jgi:hypothetical protein
MNTEATNFQRCRGGVAEGALQRGRCRGVCALMLPCLDLSCLPRFVHPCLPGCLDTSPHHHYPALLFMPAMDGKHAISAQARKRDASKTPNLTKPPAKAVTISAAAVFKKQKPNTPQLRSSSRTPLRSTVKKTTRKTAVEEVHPLALAFKGEKSSAFTGTALTTSRKQ